MAATIFSPPEGMEIPDLGDFMARDSEGRANGKLNGDAYFKALREFEEQVCAWAKENGSGNLRGELVRWSVADGKASYVVFKNSPLSLIDVGGDYQIDEVFARGLRVADVRTVVRQQKTLAELFGSNNRRG